MGGAKTFDQWGRQRMTSSLLLEVENESESYKLKYDLNERFSSKGFKKYHNIYLKINI